MRYVLLWSLARLLLMILCLMRVFVTGEELDSPLPDYWSRDLQCALHLNLSIAFKTIGE